MKDFSSCKTKEYIAHKKKVHSVAWNCAGSKLASGSVDQTARVWSIDETGHGKDVELKGHQDSVDQLCWDPTQPERLSTASGDKTVRIWDARAAKCTEVIETRGENINISWSPDGNHIAVGNKDDDISIIETRKGKILKTTKFLFEVNEMAWNNTGQLFFLTTGQGTVEVFRYPDLLRPGKLESAATLQAHTANCYCIEFDSTGQYFAVGGADALVSLWSLPEMVCIRTFGRLEWPVRTLSFSHDGQLLASASEDTVIDVSSVETGSQVHAISCRAAMNTVAWHPKQYLLAFAGDDKDRHGKDEGAIRVFGFDSGTVQL